MRDYRLEKEGLLVPVLFWTLISAVPCLFLVIIDENHDPEERLIFVVVGILLPLVFLIYSIILRLRRKRFLTKGNKYLGKIIECDSKMGIFSPYYLYIQFKHQGKKKIIRTKGYLPSPDSVLTSDKCSVFELDGEFYPALFDYTRKWKVKKVDIKTNYL